MQPVVAPIKIGDSGPQVANLQETLRLLLDREVIRTFDPPNSPTAEELSELGQQMSTERTQSTSGNSTQRLVLYVQLQEGVGDGLGGAVEEKTAVRLNEILKGLGAFDPATGEFIVRGKVMRADGTLAAGVIVRACDRDLRKFQPLGKEAVTNLDGRYEIRYSRKQFCRAEKSNADLVVRVFASDAASDRDEALTECPILFNAPADAEIDLRLPPPRDTRTELESHLAEMAPLLQGQANDGSDLSVAGLTDPDIEFIAAETGIEKQHLGWLRAAHQIGARLGSDPVRAAAYGWFRRGLPTAWDELRLRPINMLRSVLLEAIEQNIVPTSLRDQMEEVLSRIPNPQVKELASLPGIASLPAEKARALLSAADGVGTVSDQVLAQLVEQKRLGADDANAVGLSVSLQHLTGGAAKLVSAALDSTFATLQGRKLERARDLALLEPADWEIALEKAGTVADARARAAEARALAMDAVEAFPHTAFVARATRVPDRIASRLEDIHPLVLRNKRAIASDFDSLDLSDFSEADRARLQTAHTELRTFANQHPGLGLHEAFSGPEGAAQGAKIASERIGWLRTVFELNPDVDFLNLDYLPDSPELQQLKFGNLSEDARSLVLHDLKAHRRVHAVTGNAIAAREVVQAGFHAASVIARTSPSEFAEKTGLDEPEARAYHAKARDLANEAAHQWFRAYELARDGATAPIRSIPPASEFFQPLTGFQELINDQPWCACVHCQSVLSPAAYFVDLMNYIEQHILRDSFKGKERHSLHLKVRRPDLWDLELTCKNTGEYVPYLDLVNDILERYLEDVLPAADAADLYEFLARQEGSFKQPFALPIERLGILLGHFDLSRYDIAKAMGASREILVRARLNVSLKEYELITSERTGIGTLAFFQQLFQITDTITVGSSDAVLPPIEMQALLRPMDLRHETVEAILKTGFVNEDGSTNQVIEVTLEKRRAEDVQNNVEWVKNLSLRRLDRIHRFTRLWRKLPWTILELDYVVRRLTNLGLGTGSDGSGIDRIVDRIVDLLELNAKWSLPVDDLMALCDIFPDKGLREDASLFDRLFNQAPFLSRDGKWPPNPTTVFTHPAWASDPQGYSVPDNNTLSRLLAGLQLADRELVELLESLTEVPDLGHRDATFDPVTNQPLTDESVSVWQPSLRVLYHHARLLRLLGRTVTEFNKLLALTPRIAARPAPERYIRDLEDVQSVVAFAEWQKGSGFTLDEILYVTRGTPLDGSRDPAELVGDIVEAVIKDKSLEFVDTVFTELGLTDIQSRKMVTDNLSESGVDRALESVAGGQRYRLKAGFDPATGTLVLADPTIEPPVDPGLFRKLLGKYYAMEVLDAALGGALALSPQQTRALRELALTLGPAVANAVATALHGGIDRTLLVGLVAATSRYRALFKNPAFDLPGLRFVNASPTLFGLSTDPATRTTTTDVVRSVASYVALAVPRDLDFTSASAAVDPETLQTVLSDVAGASDADIADVLRTDRARIGGLKPHLTLPSQPFDALDVLARCMALAELMGVSGETFGLMSKEESTATATHQKLSRAAEDVFSAFRAKYPGDKTFQEKMEPYEDKLRTRKRDALVDFLIRKWPEPFADPNKLYAYFLIDVLLEGCARTSKLVAAISSLQLYVQRVIMHLEFSPDGVYARFSDSQKQDEWYWRQHYRVWEANRKVFLYPENYIEPQLRDDKTPLFEELEDTLLQGEINDLNVRDAYAKYLDGFDEAARLKIAGAYYDDSLDESGRPRDILHLFGVTQDSPPGHYYRVIDQTLKKNPRMPAWKKLALQIPARKVSPIACDGRLYLFWLETTTRAVTSITGGSSTFTGYRHAVRVKYSTLRADGSWAAPQSLRFFSGGVTSDSRAVNDPRDQEQVELRDQIAAAEKQVEALQAPAKAAQEELERASERLVAAQTALAKPLTFAEQADAAPRIEAVRLTFTSTFAASLGATPPVAERLAVEAALGLMTRWVPESSVGSLGAAGVVVGPIQIDAYQVAQRKHAVYIAALLVPIARITLGAALQVLAPAQAVLNGLTARRKAITVKWDKSGRDHSEPVDDYSPQGWRWDRVYPSVSSMPNSSANVIRLVLAPSDDAPKIFPNELDQPAGVLREIPLDESWWAQMYRLSNTNGAVRAIGNSEPMLASLDYFYATQSLNAPVSGGAEVAIVPPDADVQIVNGETGTIIVEARGDIAWLRKAGTGPYRAARLGTTLSDGLLRHFAQRDDLSGLLDPGFQQTLKESRPKIQAVAGQSRIDMPEDPFDPENHPSHPYLTYLRETFFHIPFLVANHLNGEQKFAQAQRWYHYIFNPTADGDPWRCRELQIAPPTSLRSLLTNGDALDAYRADPFNPHAIARTRLSAYQKAIVMKYIDNLLDWGDALFSQFMMESVNEATMLYVIAQEILGPRPPELSSCGEGKVAPRNYNKIREGLNQVNDLLIELEASSGPQLVQFTPQKERTLLVIQPAATAMSQQASTVAGGQLVGSRFARLMLTGPTGAASSAGPVGASAVGAGIADFEGVEFVPAGGNYWTNVGGTPLSDLYLKSAGGVGGGAKTLGISAGAPRTPGTQTPPIDFENPAGGFTGSTFGVGDGGKITPFDRVPPFIVKHGTRDIQLKGPNFEMIRTGFQPVDVVPPPSKNAVFCIPPNADLIAYWNRVEDRLFKIRNCMDIAGVRRRLELFAPEIDPRLLVRMKAAGLTLDDVLNSIAGNVPPYRFTYLIDKAKQFAGTLQNFGAQLLSALEKRDGEELSRLRAVHEQNLVTMRKRMTKLEIDAAQDTVASLEQQKEAATYRQEHFRSLSMIGLVPAEQTQQARQKEASQFRTMASVAQYLAGILSIIPDAGAPTAMKFGGSQLGAAGRSVAEGLNAIAGFNEMAASAAGIEASNQRRDQEWKHQAETARRDILQVDKQITAANFRKEIAEEAQKVHEKTIVQAEEVFNFLRDKFSCYDRYTFLSKRLRELYRVAFKSALSMARMAEQAYSAERTDDDTRLTGNYWDSENLGLLAGERLLSDLQLLEQQYIEKNYRQLEIEQSFSLAQVAPDLLLKLRLEGNCEFAIPELFFDLTYPGHYRRRLKAVRLTIPCVTGPYTNVGATLRLVSSLIRLKPFDPPVSVPLRHTVSIAASKGQYDAGVLDFNFRDERYMPFEGAGALSTWNLSLPATVRVFDYDTISDVILHLAYTAEFEGRLRDTLESELQNQTGRLLEFLRAKDPAPGAAADTAPPLTRVISLRHDFPDAFRQLMSSPVNTEVTFALERRHFPFFLMGRPLKATRATLRVVSPLTVLATPGTQRATLSIRQKVEPEPPRGFRDLQAPTGTATGAGMKEFDFGNVLSKQAGELGGIAPPLIGEYLIVLRRAGRLAPSQTAAGIGPIDSEKLHDILIQVGYGLA